MITGFSVENYRAFARRQTIEMRPLTLFFGWNSAGKSALVRFLPLLAESFRLNISPVAPLWLSGHVGRGASWPELVCQSTGRDSLRFSLRWAGEKSCLAEWDIRGDLDGTWQEIQSLTVTIGEHERTFSFHTRAQMTVANLLVETAKAQTEPSLLVETHSEILLMSVQLAIAKGEIDPDMVRVYWVESRSDGTSDAVPVDFDDHGQPKQTALMGAFNEAVQLGQALVAMQMPKIPV